MATAYFRVIPRDLFNDANLLKCYGQLALADCDGKLPEGLSIEHRETSRPFQIQMDPSSGATTVENVVLIMHDFEVPLFRPVNSREEWPLMFQGVDDDGNVFNDDGTFHTDLLDEIARTAEECPTGH